jgi:hypothetical protein
VCVDSHERGHSPARVILCSDEGDSPISLPSVQFDPRRGVSSSIDMPNSARVQVEFNASKLTQDKVQ